MNARTTLILLCALSVAVAGLSGCGPGPSPEDKEAQAVTDEFVTLGDAARKAEGDFSRLSESDKQRFRDRVGGNEQAAREMVSRMAGTTGPRRAVAQ